MTLLDVGQGLSAVVQTKNHTLVFDTGAKYSEQYDMGKAVVIPFLKHQAIKSIDSLVISHADNDHIGGAKSILEQMPVNRVLTSVPASLVQYAPVACQAGQVWIWDQVLFEILSPPSGNKLTGENNNSCVLKITSQQNSLLLTGDIEKNAEAWLIKHASKQLRSDVLVAPHHGSNTSSTLGFLQHVSPDFILIPAGYRNRFSLPHQAVLKRYQTINAMVFNTANEGALNVRLSSEKIEIESFRSKQRKYWNN
jgi:competence protein ComEC